MYAYITCYVAAGRLFLAHACKQADGEVCRDGGYYYLFTSE